MSQSNLKKAFSKLRIEVGPRRRIRNPDGPEGRLMKMRKTVTALVKYERIEVNYHRGDESRGYAERLISEAIRYGECHKETMELASYWLLENQLVHKLFKVLVPRYQDCTFSYTRMFRTPREYPGTGREKCVLELRGNIYPSLLPDSTMNFRLLHNRLLEEMRNEYESEMEENKKEASKGAKREKLKTMKEESKVNNENLSDGGRTNASDEGSLPRQIAEGNRAELNTKTVNEEKRT